MKERFAFLMAAVMCTQYRARVSRGHQCICRAALTTLQAAWGEAVGERRINPKDAERERERMDEDLRLAAEQLTKVRRERLREQYHSEMEGWQRELCARGLSIQSKLD